MCNYLDFFFKFISDKNIFNCKNLSWQCIVVGMRVVSITSQHWVSFLVPTASSSYPWWQTNQTAAQTQTDHRQ